MAGKNQKSYEGLQSHIRTLKTPKIDVWKNQYADRDYTVHLAVPEFTCLCPKTGLPDFATIKVSYGPNQYCAELKSFKMYLIWYRNVGIFHEHFVSKILDDLVKSCRPRWARVEAVMNARGGIQTTVVADYPYRK